MRNRHGKPCTHNDIKDLLPAYLTGETGPEERVHIEAHAATCEDCRTELALLQAFAQDPVPDPGAAFWSALPDRVYRAAKEQEQRPGPGRALREWVGNGSRFSWAPVGAVAVIVVAATGILLLRHEVKHREAALPSAVVVAYERTGIDDRVDVSALEPAELETADQWANRELRAVVRSAHAASLISAGTDLEDEVADLDAAQLKKFTTLLESRLKEG